MPILILEGLLLIALISIAIGIIMEETAFRDNNILRFRFMAMLLYAVLGAADVALPKR
ncbi:MAG: hypothetical protein ACLTK0_09545 [Anaerovoracaceae bacterium]